MKNGNYQKVLTVILVGQLNYQALGPLPLNSNLNLENKMATKLNEETIENIKNLLCNAFEGGSNYWYMIDSHNKKDIPSCEYVSQLLGFEGSKMTISDNSGDDSFEAKEVTHDDVLKAWIIFSTDPEHSHHYEDLVNENDDATTGDVFLQLAVFGEVIFG